MRTHTKKEEWTKTDFEQPESLDEKGEREEPRKEKRTWRQNVDAALI